MRGPARLSRSRLGPVGWGLVLQAAFLWLFGLVAFWPLAAAWVIR